MMFDDIKQVVLDRIEFAEAHGLLIKPGDIVHAPFTLYPTPFSKTGFNKALKMQTLFNELYDSVSRDDDFICGVMSKTDDFMKRLFEIYKQRGTEIASLSISRSDYLQENEGIKQVEFNTIACGLPSLSSLVSDLHRHFGHFDVPENQSMIAVPKGESSFEIGIHAAWKLFGNPQAVAIMVVQPREWNIFDQRWIEYKLKDLGVQLYRKTLREVAQGKLVDGNLLIDGKLVSVVYFRAGYTPSDYPTEKEWDARLLIEQSNSIKCPNVAYHIVGSKKVQQVLAMPGVVEKYIKDPQQSALLRSCFTGLYPLDDSPEGLKAVEMALQTPERFVMKPQREGGGNNIYGADIVDAIKELSDAERSNFILMEKIQAPSESAVCINNKSASAYQITSELGIYGVFLRQGDQILLNEACGHLLRSKSSEKNEGGVSLGLSSIDSPLLI